MPSTYVKKGRTPEGDRRRLRAFRHNSYSGHAHMMCVQADKMLDSDTLTADAKETAAKIHLLASQLLIQLKTRNDDNE